MASLCLVAALLAASPTAARAQTDVPSPTYTVQEGDSLFTIALAFGTTVESLQQANDIADPSLLSVGQTLVIPGFEDLSGALLTHRVQLGETLPGLAKRLGIPVETLIRINRLINPELLYVGQSLIHTEASGGLATGTTNIMRGGQSLIEMAARSGSNVWALSLLNDLPDTHSAYPGQSVVIPSDSAPPLTGLPQPLNSLTLKPSRPVQGYTLEVIAQAAEGTTLNGTLGDWQLNFADDPAGRVALQGIHVFSEPGLYPLIITATVTSGETTVFEQMIPVADGQYQYQELFVGAEQSALLDASITGPERDRVQAIASGFTPQRYWQGLWIKPVPSDRVTTAFGLRRSYNGGPYDSYHDGIDWGASGGTPIVAPAAGTVVFAEPLTVRGNATIIDHGWGVFTGYWHQFKINVTAGQAVQAGEVIGEVGSSGLSTGSHLHFVVWVGGVQVQPEQWLSTEFP